MRPLFRAGALVALAVLSLPAVALANGADVLTATTAARDALADARDAAQARVAEIGTLLVGADPTTAKALSTEAKGLASVVKAVDKALPSFAIALTALRQNDIPAFAKGAVKAVSGFAGVLKAGAKADSAAYTLDAATLDDLSQALRDALTEGRDSIDDSAEKAKGAAEKALVKADAAIAKGQPGKAPAAYLGAIDDVALAPVAVDSEFGHPAIHLRGLNGRPVNLGISVVPYSPKQTCGACHDYDAATMGFHFQQGFEDISDTYAATHGISPDYILSDGMYGRW